MPIDRQWMVPFPFIDRVLDTAGMLQRQIRTVCFVQKTGESTAQFLDLVVTVPVVANDRDVWVQTVQKRSGSAASAVLVVVDVAVSMRRQVPVLPGSASDQSIDKVVDCNEEMRKRNNKKQEKDKKRRKKEEKKEKRAQRGFHKKTPEMAPKIDFLYIRIVKRRNKNEIEAQKVRF